MGKGTQEFYDAQDDGIPSAPNASFSGSTFANGVKPVKVGFLVCSLPSPASLDASLWKLTSAFFRQCEQVSHHPPISSAYYYCPDKGIEVFAVRFFVPSFASSSTRLREERTLTFRLLLQIDQIAAKVSGMSIRIGPGSLNKASLHLSAPQLSKRTPILTRPHPSSFAHQGTFLKLNQGPGQGEEYQISNPQANVNGLLKGT